MRLVLAAILVLSACISADAQWLYQGGDSAFGGTGTKIAATSNLNYVFAFRCDEAGPVAVYLTPETLDNSDVAALSVRSQILMRVDDGEVSKIFALPDSADRRLRVTSIGVMPGFLETVRDARKRISVAIAVGDRVIHEQSFSASGSTKAISQFLKACPVDSD